MNYRTEFEYCFEYIEQNLKNHLDSAVLAGNTGYSLFHFCRIFRIYKNMTPMEYITDRRLTASLKDLDGGRRITDIALDYQFETPAGYTKAFHKKFGMSPSDYKKGTFTEGSSIVLAEQGIKVCYKLKEIRPFAISGYYKELDYDQLDYSKSMAAFWDYFEENNIESQMYETLNPDKHGEIGICITDNSQSSVFKYMLGVAASLGDHGSEFLEYSISGGKYAVFTTPAVDMTKNDNEFNETIKKVWKYIYTEWFIRNEFERDMDRLDFEYYDERCHNGSAAVMDIYVPVK